MLKTNWIYCAFGPSSIVSRGLVLGAETATRISAPEWDALSGLAFKRKLHPGIRLGSGMHFPTESLAETASQNRAPEWDALSVGRSLGKYIPV